MPDDNLFDDDKPGDDKDKGDDTKPDEGAAKVAALEQQLAELSKARDDGVADRAQLTSAIGALQQQLQALQADDDDDGPPPSEDAVKAARQAKFTKFYEDPEGFIAKEAELRAKATLGPYLRMQAEQRRDEILESQQARIDALHGPGTWDKLFAKQLGATMAELPLEMQASRPHVQRAVESIYGRLHMDDKMRDELTKGRDQVTKAKAAPPAMLDGGRPAPKPGTLDDAEQTFLASLARSGIELTAKDYLAAKTRGNTEDSWRPAPKR